MTTRRDFCLTAAAVTAGAALGPLVRSAAALQDNRTPITAIKLRPGAWMLTEGGGNSLLLNSPAGPVLVDTKIAGEADELAYLVQHTIKSAPTLVINTHHHQDHIGGNYIFERPRTFVAHERMAPRVAATLDGRIRRSVQSRARRMMRAGDNEGAVAMMDKARSLTAEQFLPTKTVGNAENLEHGGIELRLRHFGPGHTDNDLVVQVPQQNLMHVGDLVFNGRHPFVDVAGGASTTGWQKSLAAAYAMCNAETVVIPGHGDRTDRNGLMVQSRYFDIVRGAITEAIDNGVPRKEIGGLKIPDFADYPFSQAQAMTYQAVHDEIIAARNPVGPAAPDGG